MQRQNFKAWSIGSEAYSSDPEEDEEEEEEDMVFGESDQDGMAEEMMDLSDLPTALFACSVHNSVFEQDVHRVRRYFLLHISDTRVLVCVTVCSNWCIDLFKLESYLLVFQSIQESKSSNTCVVLLRAYASVSSCPADRSAAKTHTYTHT